MNCGPTSQSTLLPLNTPLICDNVITYYLKLYTSVRQNYLILMSMRVYINCASNEIPKLKT